MEQEPSPITAPVAAIPDDEIAEEGTLQTYSLATDAPDAPLRLSEGLRARVREMERIGTRQAPRHRMALIGASELDEARPSKSRSGAFRLLEAVYARGERHWLDPEQAIAPLKDILFKEGAPLGVDRGVHFVLTRLARAGISPAAFALHVVMPRMEVDYDWRRWKSRHTWVLGSIADILIDLRASPPWDGERLGSSAVLADVALCKYVGRPLARIPSERFAEQEGHLVAWAQAWKSFSFSSPGFLAFMRRTVLPCLYRLSGRIDPEQLAPIARSLSDLERTLGRRISAMSPAAAQTFLESAGLSDSFEIRIEKRAASGAGAYALAMELRGYAELAAELSNLDAGPAVLGRAASLSLGTDAAYLGDAAALVRAIRHDEGAALARWHLDDFSKLPSNGRAAYIAAVAANGGAHPRCPFARPQAAYERRSFDAEALALALGLDIGPLLDKDGSPPDLPAMRRAYFSAAPAAARLYDEMATAVASGADRGWDEQTIRRFDGPGPGFHELAIRGLIPGLGTGFSFQSLKEPSLAALHSRWGAASAGSAVRLVLALELGSSVEAGRSVEAAGKDAVRARIALSLIEGAWRALVSGDGDPECGSVFAALGKEAAQARRRLADAKAGAKTDSAADGGSARSILALGSRLALMDAAFESMKDVPPASGDPRRFALAMHMAAFFFKQGDTAAFDALAGAAARYASDQAFSRVAARLASDVAPGFMGVEQAALVADAIDALCHACAADASVGGALAGADGELAAALRGSSRLKGGVASTDSMDAALRRAGAYPRITAETAKWRDLLARLETGEAPRRHLTMVTSRSFVDAYYGDMGGICLSAKPELILRPGTMVCRLWDDDERRIRGMCLFVYSAGPARSAGIGKFWYAFAFNPLRSMTRGMGSRELAILWLGFRAVAEELSARSGLPVLIPGLGQHGPSVQGAVSNDGAFATLVANYELAAGSPIVTDASGFSIYYTKAVFAEAAVAIDPRRPGSYRARAELARLGALRQA